MPGLAGMFGALASGHSSAREGYAGLTLPRVLYPAVMIMEQAGPGAAYVSNMHTELSAGGGGGGRCREC